MANRGFEAGRVHFPHEKVAVFGVHDCLDRGSKHLHAILGKDAGAMKFGTAVECRLTPECKENSVRTLLFDDLRHEKRRHRQEIHLVRNAFRRLDRSNIRVDEDRADAFFTEGLEGLGTGIVKFAGLSDFEGSRAQNEYFSKFCLHIVVVESANLIFICLVRKRILTVRPAPQEDARPRDKG